MERKSDKVRRLVAGGSFKEALRIAKGFRLGMTKAEADAMTLAYECMVHERFYKSIGYDTQQKIEEGIAVLKKMYGKSEANDLHQQIQQSGVEDRELHGSWYHKRCAEVSA